MAVRALLVAGVVGSLASFALASPARAQLSGRHVIEPGREAEVVALFAPYELGGEIVPGWRLAGIRIQQDHILADVEGPDSARATLRLDHRSAWTGDASSRSFAFDRERDDPGADPALDALVTAVQRNDVRPFWRQRALEGPGLAGRAWADGIAIGVLGLALLLALVITQLREAPRWIGAALAGVVIAGGALRLAISPVAALGVWPYTRMLRFAALIFEGPALAWIDEALGTRIYFTELVFTTNLIIATLTPLAAYAHAHYVLRDPRAALACAALFAWFPNHIRFSHSEVEFVLSLALSSATLALLHAALVERSRALQVLSAAALPFALYGAIVTRELNILLVPLMIAAALMLRGNAPRARLAVVLGGIAVGAALGFAYLVENYSAQLRDGLSVQTALNSIQALFSTRYNTLVNPRVTPLGITVLAVLGSIWMWRAGDRRHVVFLLGWLGFYFAAHSYVLPHELAMQARYHLHLATPLLLLAAPAVIHIWDRRRRLAWAVVAYVAAAPLLHLDFIRDTEFNDMREYAFVRGTREVLPEGCTVLEYQGLADHDVRYPRIGTVLEDGERRLRWRVIPIAASDPGAGDVLRPEVRELLADPPECLAYYEGINCWAVKDVDEPIAPACAAMREAAPLEDLARVRFESRPYDENLARGFGPEQDVLTLTLHRVRPRTAHAPEGAPGDPR